jgi:PBSX family phage terminase large subunit
MRLNPRQSEVIKDILTKRSRLNILDGSIRSSKTIASNVLLNYVAQRVPGNIVVAARTLDTLKYNVLMPLREMLPNSVTWHNGGRDIRIGGRQIRGVGAANEGSEGIIRGSTIKWFFFDEMTLLSYTFIQTALGRMSEDGAMMVGTTNPDSPYHPVKKDLIDRRDELNLAYYKFSLDDNTKPHGFLDKFYVDSLKKEYGNSPLWYRRFILGEWVQAEGAVYDRFDHEKNVGECPKQFKNVIACGDYGTSNPTVFLLIGWDNPAEKIYVFKEYYHDSKKDRQKEDAEYVADFLKFTAGYSLLCTYIDPSAASLSLALRNAGVRVKPADNSVLDGIKTVGKFLHITILDKSCKNLIEQIAGYVWDTAAQKRGEDKPLKLNDHAPDALRYGLHTHFGNTRTPFKFQSAGIKRFDSF